ncbi:MAG: C1 family peptidase, partial [Bacteriovoracaceae bacterium]
AGIDVRKQTNLFKKEEDIRMDHYVTNKYNGQNQFKFLQLIRSSLYPSKGGIGNPVTVALCSKSIRSQSSQFGSRNDTQCGNHIVNVVGAYYENGQCKVRIRNSWGNDWEDNGHISITVSEFLASQELYSKVNKTSDLYNATWIKGTHSNSLAASTRDIDDNGYFEGVYDYTFQDGKEIQRQVKKGVPSRRKRHDGTVTEVFHIRLRNGNTYSGTVNDRNNGQWGLKSGLETDSNGRLVYAHKYRLHNGQIYTGRIKETTNGEFRTLD